MAHALSEAPVEFRQRMFLLRDKLNGLENTVVLPFAWDPVKGPAPENCDVYMHDVVRVGTADLMVMVCEYPSTGMGGEFERRVGLRTPLLVFTPRGKRVSRFVSDGIKQVRKSYCDEHDPNSMFEWPDAFEYGTDDEIFRIISGWVKGHLPSFPHLPAVVAR